MNTYNFPTEHSVKPVQKRLLIPIFSVMFILFVTFYVALFLLLHNQIESNQKNLTQNIQTMLDYLIKDKIKLLSAIEKDLIENSDIKTLLIEKNRKELIRRYEGFYSYFKALHAVTHFYIHDAKGVNIVRLHQINRYGDAIKRYTLLEAKQHQSQSAGLELGPLGTFTLRVVQPIFKEHTLIGFIELGIDLNHFLQTLLQLFSVDVALLIDKNQLNPKLKHTLKTSKLQSIKAQNSHPYYLSFNSLKDKKIRTYVLKSLHDDTQSRQVSIQSHTYQVSTLKIKNVQKIPIAHLLIFKNISDIKQNFNHLIILLSVGTMIVILVLFGFLKSLLVQTDKEIAEQDQTIKYQAHYDALTALPNRLLSLDRLEQLLLSARRNEKIFALLFIDLDNFKHINDTLGHDIGDALLIEVANRFKQKVRASDTVGRLGGDEFIVLLDGIHSQEDAVKLTQEFQKLFKEPFNIEGHPIHTSCSIGIALYPYHGQESTQLLKSADLAMYHAKAKGRNQYALYLNSMDQKLSRHIQIETQLKSALAKKELQLYYQPKIDLKSGRVCGAEALLRWDNPVLGRISPEQFIPIAEQSQVIIDIGRFVFKEALQSAKTWSTLQGKPFHMAINLSPKQFQDPTLLHFIKKSLTDSAIDPSYIELEITEGLMIQATQESEHIFEKLKKMGFKLSMDDFGTGFASLSHLRRFPFDILKIDRTFIFNMLENEDDRELVNATIAMAKSLNLKVVAEGVEDGRVAQRLKEKGCDEAQGYYYAQALSKEDFEAFLADFNS